MNDEAKDAVKKLVGEVGRERLSEIEARERQASPGPWFDGRGQVVCRDPKTPGLFRLFKLDSFEMLHADCIFVAHARTDVPDLIAALKAAWKQRDELLVRVKTAETTLVLGLAAANETLETVKDDGDCAATIACTLKDACKLSLSALTTAKVL